MAENEFSYIALKGFKILNHSIGNHFVGIEDEKWRALFEENMKNQLMLLSGEIGNHYFFFKMFAHQANPIIKNDADKLIRGLEKLWTETSGRGELSLEEIPNLAKEVMSSYKTVYEFYKNSNCLLPQNL